MHSEIDDRCFSVFFVEIQLKKENLKSVFWVPEFRCPHQCTCLPNGLDLSLNVAVVVVPFSQKLIFSIPLEIKTKCAVCFFCKFVRQFLDLAIFCSMSFSLWTPEGTSSYYWQLIALRFVMERYRGFTTCTNSPQHFQVLWYLW